LWLEHLVLQWQRIPAVLERQSRVNTQQTGLFTQ